MILTVSSSLRKMERRRTNFFARTRAHRVIEAVGFKEMVDVRHVMKSFFDATYAASF